MIFECYRNGENHSEYLVSDNSMFGLGKIYIGNFYKILELQSKNLLIENNIKVVNNYDTGKIQITIHKEWSDDGYKGVLHKETYIPYSQFELIKYEIKEDTK
jgi:hypothetical protein